VDEDYQRLRGELEAAYQASVWDTASLDRITAQLADVERTLACSVRQQRTEGRDASVQRP
jgi:Tfp pilus assembly protein PilO